MWYKILSVIIILQWIVNVEGRSQGSLLLVGGGSEKAGGWSDSPYTWAIEQSNNKRVAIITYETNPTDWLPDYFLSLGASRARNFIIPNSATADNQETYDSLITYDVVFFKGGNQWVYYERYKNTATQQAVEWVFGQGGVIGGTSAGLAILSEIVYTAKNGTVYPEEALENPYNPYMTLSDDFLNLFSGYVFDSHFVERARFGRLVGFLGNWKLTKDQDITGIGVDDVTAFCISPEKIGTAYGSGAVNIYKPGSGNNFRISGQKLLANSIEVIQLLNNCSINLNSFETTGLNTWIDPYFSSVTHKGRFWLSGSDQLNANKIMLEHFVEGMQSTDTLLLITKPNSSVATVFSNYLKNTLGKPVEIMNLDETNNSDYTFNHMIGQFNHYLFIDNQYSIFFNFLDSGANGQLLKDKILSGNKAMAFVGGDSRFAGKTVLTNYQQEYASYDGLLDFGEGLGLLRNCIIIPNTFSENIDNENAASGIPYGMVNENLKYGIWLYDDCFMEYNPVGDQAILHPFGNFPMLILENNGTFGDISDQSAVSSGKPRNVAGFESFTLSLMDSTFYKSIDLVNNLEETFSGEQIIYPNPANNFFRVKGPHEELILLQIIDLNGIIKTEQWTETGAEIPTGTLSKDIYIVKVFYRKSDIIFTSKLVIQ